MGEKTKIFILGVRKLGLYGGRREEKKRRRREEEEKRRREKEEEIQVWNLILISLELLVWNFGLEHLFCLELLYL